MAKDLTPKQKLFVKSYLASKNATQAAIEAGYSKKTAHSAGPRMLEHVGVAAAIERGMQQIHKRLEKAIDLTVYNKERWLKEVIDLAFLDTLDFYSVNQDGKMTLSIAEMKERGMGRMIKKIRSFPDGKVEIEAHSKQHMLELYGKHHGWVTENVSITNPTEELTEADFDKVFGDAGLAEMVLKVGTAISKTTGKKTREGETT